MKKYIRAMIDDLHRKREKGFKPAIPKPSTEGPKTPSPDGTLPDDLENQELSHDPAERARQLDFQAQENEEREGSS